jgi:hypothetical protein
MHQTLKIMQDSQAKGGEPPDLTPLLERMARLQHRPADQARLGMQCQPADDICADQLDLPRGQGQIVLQVTPGGAAAKAGILANDILLELDGKPVPRDRSAFLDKVAAIRANVPIDAVVMRKGVKKTLKGLSLPVAAAHVPAGAAAGQGQLPRVANRAGFPMGPVRRFGPRGGPMRGFGRGFELPGAAGQKDFHATSEQNGVTIDVQGTVNNGTVSVNSIKITDGMKVLRPASVDEVPAAYREQVRGVIQRATRRNITP